MNKKSGLKVLAFVIAVILWAYVRVTVGGVTANAVTQLELHIPLEIKGGGSNLIAYERSTDTIILTLRGDSEVVKELREGLVRAYVDLEGMAPGSNWPEVQVLVPGGVQIIEVDPSSVNVQISPLMVKEVPIKISTAGSPQTGFKVGIPIFEPKTVKLSGPEELVRQVSVVSGVVPVDNQRENLAITVNNLLPLNDNDTAVMGVGASLKLETKEVRATIPIEQSSTLATLFVLTEKVKIKKQAGFRYVLTVEPQSVQFSTTLDGEDLPNGVQVDRVTLEPQGANPEIIDVPLVEPEGGQLVGTTMVKLTLVPKKIPKEESSS